MNKYRKENYLELWPEKFDLERFTRDAFHKLKKKEVINISYLHFLNLVSDIQRTLVKREITKVGDEEFKFSNWEFTEEFKDYELSFLKSPEKFTELIILKYEEKLSSKGLSFEQPRPELNLNKDELINILKQL